MERVDLREVRHAERQRWRAGGEWDPDRTAIAVGQVGASWYVRWYDDWIEPPACVYSGPRAEHYARATARRWMRTFGGDWMEA